MNGGELMDAMQRPKAQRESGGCADCALGGKKECPYAINQPIQIKKVTGDEGCSAFIPKK